ncbi:MAG: AMP-binding protein [Pseudomonadota bacterium]|jgi:acyl-CoA synthetase (AMP-forming)/AMP-acid ligase II|nr:AMP-binding protein [Pseudomonadota bacterium]
MTNKADNKLHYRNTTIAAQAQEKAAATPDAVAVYLESGEHITFGAILDEARRLAVSLQDLGLVAGDVVSFQLPNWREAVALDIAASLLGLVVNPVIPIYRDRELAFILDDAAAKVLFIPDRFRNFDYPEMVRRLRPDLPNLAQVVVVRRERDHGDMLDYRALVDGADGGRLRPAAVDPDSVKIVMYTSGTTGRAKAVRHSHNTLARALDNTREAWGLSAADVMLMPSPVTHITGFANGIEMPFFTDTRSAFMERWDVDLAIDYIERVGATLCISATPFLQELVQRAAERGLTLPSLRIFACGGASVPPTLIRDTHRVLDNCRAFRVYGSTEAPLVTVGFLKPEEEALAAETDGRYFNWEVEVIDDNGQVLPLGRDGEITVRGPAMMLGYGDEAQTRDAFTPRGFFLTGDIGHLTPEGAIVITDRKKDIIIRGGENLSAREIEDVLYAHPDIQEVAVVAMPHERLGEGVCACVVPRPGAEPLSLDALKPFLAENRLAKQKWPERIELHAELPKTASGKVRKDLLRKDLWQRLAGPGR